MEILARNWWQVTEMIETGYFHFRSVLFYIKRSKVKVKWKGPANTSVPPSALDSGKFHELYPLSAAFGSYSGWMWVNTEPTTGRGRTCVPQNVNLLRGFGVSFLLRYHLPIINFQVHNLMSWHETTATTIKTRKHFCRPTVFSCALWFVPPSPRGLGQPVIPLLLL